MALTHVRGSGSLTHTSKNRKCLHFSSKSSPSPQNKNVTVSGWVSFRVSLIPGLGQVPTAGVLGHETTGPGRWS